MTKHSRKPRNSRNGQTNCWKRPASRRRPRRRPGSQATLLRPIP